MASDLFASQPESAPGLVGVMDAELDFLLTTNTTVLEDQILALATDDGGLPELIAGSPVASLDQPEQAPTEVMTVAPTPQAQPLDQREQAPTEVMTVAPTPPPAQPLDQPEQASASDASVQAQPEAQPADQESESEEAELQIVGVRPTQPPPPADQDSDSDEETELQIVGVRPALPPPPARHPYNGKPNMVTDDMYSDPSTMYSVFTILDRIGQPPNRAYLVQWSDDNKDFIGTWEWGSNLRAGRDLRELLDYIDKWKDTYTTLSYRQYRARFQFTFTASESGDCFFDALQLACVVLGDQSLVSSTLIDEWKAKQDIQVGVSTADIFSFVDYLIHCKAPLACKNFMKNHLTGSCPTVEMLMKRASELDDGVYVVGAGSAEDVRHCFVLKKTRDCLQAFDDFNPENPEDYSVEPLEHLQWIQKVFFVRRVQRIGKISRNKKRRIVA